MLTDAQWARIEPLLPPVKGPMGKPFTPHRPVVEGCIYRSAPAVRGGWSHPSPLAGRPFRAENRLRAAVGRPRTVYRRISLRI
jgi:transposase